LADFNGMFPEDVMHVLDGGRVLHGGDPPAELRFKTGASLTRRTNAPPQPFLEPSRRPGSRDSCTRDGAWKIWGMKARSVAR